MTDKYVDVYISLDGKEMRVEAQNFKGRGCKALVDAFRQGKVLKEGNKPEYNYPEPTRTALRSEH